jgi:hypothetical protein
MSKGKLWIGIDPGKQGAIVSIDSFNNVETYVMPLIAGEYDLQKLKQFMNQFQEVNDLHLIIEDVHAIFRASANSSFEFGVGVGIVRMATVMAEIPFTLVQPKMWQKTIFEGVSVIKKPGKREEGRGSLDTKAMALIAAQRLYPKLNLMKSDKSKKPHEGIVDALLIAHYCKLKF